MLILVWANAVADAQTWAVEASGVLVAAPGTITANGVGSPAVAWDPALERYVMFFETRTGAATATCPGGLWSIGVAASDDGLAWDVWPDAVIAPTENTPWRCVAAHPTVVYDSGTYHLWFKAEQGSNACSAVAQPWGCGNYSGIAHATVAIELDDKSAEIAQVDADIAAVQAERDAAMDAFAAALAQYEADILAGQAEFECAEPLLDGLCAPCGSFRIDAPEGGYDFQPVCQDFAFTVPGQVSVLNLSKGHWVPLSFTTTAGANVVCDYRKNGGLYTLDSNPMGPVDARCVAPNQALVAGSAVTTDVGVQISINFASSSPNAWVDLTATNYASQTFDGYLFDTFDGLGIPLAQRDYDTTAALLPGFRADLQELLDWYAPFTPEDAEKAQLEADGQALLAQAAQLEADLAAWAAELEALEAEREALLAYEQSVAVSSLPNGVGLQINRTFGFPAAMKQGAVWVLLFQDYPNIWRATAASPDGPFVVDTAPAISRGVVSWANTEVYDPNLMCNDDPVYPYEAYFGGRSVSGGTFTSGGISDGVSSDTVTWMLNTVSQYFGWTDVNEFRHFDVIRASDGAYRMWYTDKVGGTVQVNVASTTAAYADGLSAQRVCP